MDLEVCKQNGHKLKEVRRVVGYECTEEGCGYYISLGDESHNINIGERFSCPRCRLSGRDNSKWKFSKRGMDYADFQCPNCGYKWTEG